MGFAKREWEEYLERGWSAPDKNVCEECVEDRFLKETITGNLAARKCDYCGKGGRGYIAAPVAVIMEPIASTFFYFFNDPVNAGVPYDGGLVFEATHTTDDALQAIGLECHDDLFVDVVDSFENCSWIETASGHWASSHPSETMAYAWEHFVRVVKHETRFFFSSVMPARNDPDEYAPTVMLTAIGRMVSELELIKPLSSGTMLYRVRKRGANSTWPLDETHLGAPPNEQAKSQRMNPAGISYLYLAQEQATALAEVLSKPPCQVAIGSIACCRDLWLLDLSKPPPMPSIFDSERHSARELILLLGDFVREISKPVRKDGREHIDYVPSQVVSEYFAKVFTTEDGASVDGMAYPSAVRPG